MKHATMCYVQKADAVLMIHRNLHKNDIHYGLYVPPGGKIERGERPIDCVVRELQEEAGLDLQNPNYRGLVIFDNQNRILGTQKNQEDWEVHIYSANNFRGSLKRKCESGSLLWVPESKLLTLPMHEGDKIILSWLKVGRRFEGIFRYSGERLLEANARFGL